MKNLIKFSFVATAIALATACDPAEQGPVDYPIEGNFTISASYSAMVHGGGYGWRNGEKIGVFVTSEGVAQANLLYTPSDTSKVTMVTGTNYWGEVETYEERSVVGDVELTAASEVAGFKKGEHNIYAYTQYVEGATDYTAVPLPNLAAQVSDDKSWMNYGFGYAKTAAAIKEYSSANISLGDFMVVTWPISIKGIELTDAQANIMKDQKITSVKLVSTDLDIAVTDGKINLATGEITGTKSKEIVVTFPDGGIDVKFEAGIPAIGWPDVYMIPTVSVYANIDTEKDITTRQEEYTAYEDTDNNPDTPKEAVTKYKDVACLKGSFTVVYTIGGVEYTATTVSSTQKLAATDEYMAFPLATTLQ